MYPLLYQNFGIVVTSFGVFATLALLAFLLGVIRASSHREVSYRLLFSHLPMSVFSFALGAKLSFWLSHAFVIYEQITSLILMGHYGSVLTVLFNVEQFYVAGGFIGFAVFLAYFFKKEQQRFLPWFDVLVTASLLALSVGYIGSLLGGYYFGTEADSFLSVIYSGEFADYSLASRYINIPVHPLGLYAAIGSFFMFLLTSRLLKRFKVAGLVGVVGTLLFSLQIFLLGFLRSPTDPTLVFLGGLHLNQWLAIILFILSILIFTKKVPRITA